MTTIARTIPETAVLRAVDGEAEGTLGILSGHAARFNEWTEIDSWYEGHFIERIAPGAFRKTIKERAAAIRCLYRHGWDPQIGDKVLGTLSVLREDAEGLWYEAPLDDTSYGRDLAPGLRNGQYGASFRGAVVKETWNKKPAASDYNPNALPERSLTELSLRELGPCTFGAYESATASLRSLDDMFERLQARPDLLEQFLARATDLRTRRAEAAHDQGTSDSERAAATTGVEPPAEALTPAHINRIRSDLIECLAGAPVQGEPR